MKFSLILCTVNRTKELKFLLDSLLSQTYKNFEVIVVDQNKDERVLKVLNRYSELNIIYLKSEIGLSKARNVGLKKATGKIVAFPDDDCIYPEKLLENVCIFFSNSNYDILMGKTIDKTGKVVAGKPVIKPQDLKPSYILGSSTTLFVKKSLDVVFDERFGLGGIFYAEEENDLLFRLLKEGYKGYYEPNINYVYHPPSDLDFSNYKRARLRAKGLGVFIAKHLFTKEGAFFFVKYNLIRPLFGALLYFLKKDIKKSKFYFNRFIGIWIGFFKYFKEKNENNI